jgi:antitoxin (DNA-binding transcriptional repressor) of toxin-antitoxin stability system
MFCVTLYPMPSMNMRQLRNTRQLKTWLRAGKIVELRDRDSTIARIVPAEPSADGREWPNFEARMKKVFGDRVFPNVIVEERKHSRY